MTKEARIAKNLLEEKSCYHCNYYRDNKCLIDIGNGELPIFLNCVKFEPIKELDAFEQLMHDMSEEMKKNIDKIVMSAIIKLL